MNDLATYTEEEVGSQCLPGPGGQTVSIWPTRATMVILISMALVAIATACLFLILAVQVASAEEPLTLPANPKPVDLILADQFDRKADLGNLRGAVVIMVYGDKKATDVCRKVGESLHVCWHPDAKGQPAAKARSAPVVPLENLKPGQISTNVVVVPVACCGKVPGLFQGAIRGEIAKASPDVVVWLDFADEMKTRFELREGEANVVVFDVNGRLMWKVNGTPDQPVMDRLVKVVQGLRYDGLKP